MGWLILCNLTVWLSISSSPAQHAPRTIKPVVVWTGTDSKQVKEAFARCSSQQEWQANWDKHHGKESDAAPPCPEVDFDSYMVVVLFHGQSSQNRGIRIIAVVDEAECVRLRYRPLWYQVGYRPAPAVCFAADVKEDRTNHQTQSFAFVVLPIFRKTIVLEEDIQGIIGESPLWKERARLVATQ